MSEARCRHGFDLDKWLPCPTCKPVETAALQGAPTTPEQLAAHSVKAAAMRSGALELDVRNPRSLALEGKTLAGCKVGRMAANATHGTRFHVEASCGHAAIMYGTDLNQAEKKGLALKCPACAKADQSSKRKRHRAEKAAEG